MPVEIKKMVIQAKVADTTAKATPESVPTVLSPEEMQQIVDACVKQVIKMMKREKAR
ncbi:MAG: hypothetical protein H6566_28735 [Lewinellaceae bacterium]|nr:hypothetical protein [Lewinellaceae bacterium]